MHFWLFGSLVGSLARGEAGSDSDVDVLIAIARAQVLAVRPGRGRVELCELLGLDVDVVIDEDLVPEFRSDVSSDLLQAF